MQTLFFRASTDGGQTFGEKVNLSNTTDSDSWNVETDSDADSVVITWWETNQTANIPVMRVSNNNGETFGPLLILATNGTLGKGRDADMKDPFKINEEYYDYKRRQPHITSST